MRSVNMKSLKKIHVQYFGCTQDFPRKGRREGRQDVVARDMICDTAHLLCCDTVHLPNATMLRRVETHFLDLKYHAYHISKHNF